MARVTSLRTLLPLALLLSGLAGCTYDPPIQGDHGTERYKTDLESCRKSSAEAVRLKNADTLTTWLISPVTGPPAVRAGIRSCMQTKGYVLQPAAR